jgi:immune inhibitor A
MYLLLLVWARISERRMFGAAANEYFLLENRQRAGFDVSLPGAGLLIWHVDEGQTSNTDENHYKVALMQADGARDMEHNRNRGDAGDPYPGDRNNRTFNSTSTPNSKSYSHADSHVAVTGIGPSGATMTVQIQVKSPGARSVSGHAKSKEKAGAKKRKVRAAHAQKRSSGRPPPGSRRSAARKRR